MERDGMSSNIPVVTSGSYEQYYLAECMTEVFAIWEVKVATLTVLQS